MSTFGERLRQARESQGLSIAQVATETRILQQWVIALEEGAFDRLPGEVTTKGFIRNYSQFLGLSANDMLNTYRRERGGHDTIRIVPTSSLVVRRSYVLPSFFWVFFVTVALIGVTYVTFSAIGRIGTSQIAQQVATPDSTTPIPANLTEAIADETDRVSAAPDSSGDLLSNVSSSIASPSTVLPTPTLRPVAGMVLATPTPRSSSAQAPIVVEVRIAPEASGSWLRIQTDGTTAYEQIMRSGEQRVFRAQRRITIRAGNPTAVNVSVNGKPPEVIGTTPGKPVNWSWPPM